MRLGFPVAEGYLLTTGLRRRAGGGPLSWQRCRRGAVGLVARERSGGVGDDDDAIEGDGWWWRGPSPPASEGWRRRLKMISIRSPLFVPIPTLYWTPSVY